MGECYYSYSFDLDEGLIREETLGQNIISPMHAVGCEAPLDFDDYVDVWKAFCFPVFKNPADERKLTRKYFREAFKKGVKSIDIDLEHNPLKNTYAAKYTRVHINLFTDKKSNKPRATVLWEDNAANAV